MAPGLHSDAGMRTIACALLGLALTAWLAPGDLSAGTTRRGAARKASGSRARTIVLPRPGAGPRGQLRPPSAARDPMTVTVERDARGRVANRDAVEAAARELMRRTPADEPARRATWKQLIQLADGTRFRDDAVRAAFRLTQRSERSEFGMHFATAPRGRGLPRDVHKEIYGYKPLPSGVSKALEVVTWPLGMALMVLAGDSQ